MHKTLTLFITSITLHLNAHDADSIGMTLETLPDWFKGNRVQLHWEGNLSIAERSGGLEGRFTQWLNNVHNTIESFSPKVTIGLAKRGDEGAWWPTAIGTPHPYAIERDIYSDFFLNSMQARGIEYIAYYRHDLEKSLELENSEWRCLDRNGEPYYSDRGDGAHRLCYNSPFRKIVETRLVELVERGTRGIYFDSIHMPEICTCANCKSAFETKRGYSMPEKLEPATDEYLDVAKFVSETLEDTFFEWKTATSAIDPEVVYIVGHSAYSQFTMLHHSEKLAAIIDSSKTEFQKCFGGQQHWAQAPLRRLIADNPDYWLPRRSLQESTAWLVARDTKKGAPFHAWNWKPHADYGETIHSNAALIAHGGISSTHVDFFEKNHHYPELFKLGEKIGEALSTKRPYGWIAIHVSNELKETLYPANGDLETSYRQRFEGLYAPVLGAVETLQKAHLPFVLTFDSHLSEETLFPETEILIVPNYDTLSHPMQAHIDAIEATGISVVRLHNSQQWHLAEHLEANQSTLMAELLADGNTPPIEIEIDHDVLCHYFLDTETKAMTITCVRDWNFFWFFGDSEGQRWRDNPLTDSILPGKINITDSQLKVDSAQTITTIMSTSLDCKEHRKTQIVEIPKFKIYQFIELSQ